MAKIIKEITLDAVRDNMSCTIPAKQNDAESRFIRVRITADRRPVSLNAMSTAVINALRPDGQSNGFVGKVGDDGTVTVPISTWMLALCGNVKCDVSVFDGNERLTTMPFYITVEESLYDGEGIENEQEYTVLSSLMDENQEIRTAESLRVLAEMTRVESEEERVFAETVRESAETLRETNEQARITAEEQREGAEAVRNTNEQARNTAEQQRDSAEGLREISEGVRENAERERADAESLRVAAEEERRIRESGRTTFIPSVSAEGVISWTNDKGLENPQPVMLRGSDGYTPVKGSDYWTEADRQEIIGDVLNALPLAEGSEF